MYVCMCVCMGVCVCFVIVTARLLVPPFTLILLLHVRIKLTYERVKRSVLCWLHPMSLLCLPCCCWCCCCCWVEYWLQCEWKFMQLTKVDWRSNSISTNEGLARLAGRLSRRLSQLIMSTVCTTKATNITTTTIWLPVLITSNVVGGERSRKISA